MMYYSKVGTGFHFFCRVKVCNRRLYFLVDCGSSFSIIGKHIKGIDSTFLSKDTSYALGMQSMSYENRKFSSLIVELHEDQKEFMAVTLGVMSLTKVNAYYKKHGLETIDGILGGDVIKNLHIDFRKCLLANNTEN